MDSSADHAVSGQEDASTDGYLAAEEAMSALEALGEDDLLKLMAIERGLLGGTGFPSGHLYHEAVTRMFVGQRKCPRELPLIAFLIETMRSIAYHARKRSSRDRNRLVSIEVLEQVPGDGNDAEQILIQQEGEAASVLQAIEVAFADDEPAQMLLMCWDDGIRGKELRETLGLDQAELDYLVKRVRRKVRKMYPTGWQG